MADEEHLRVLKQGAKAWNKWRRTQRKPPDLRGAKVFKMNLSRANLSHANLEYAELNVRLIHANLIGANLHGATLSGADLSFADLGRANLSGANLAYTNIHGANLVDCDLKGANLKSANLNSTHISGARIGWTTFADIDLSVAKGLESVRHEGPSSLGIDTLFKSAGSIPEVFLRGCGLPDAFMMYSRSLLGKAIDFYSCFISYSHADKAFARRLYDQLQGRGIRCWLDEHQLLPGHDIHDEVDRGIKLWDKVLLCCSKNSLSSWWVDKEIASAFDKEQRLWKESGKKTLALIPLNLDGFMFSKDWDDGKAISIKQRLAADFTGWETDNDKFEREFERVVRALRTDGGREEAPKGKL